MNKLQTPVLGDGFRIAHFPELQAATTLLAPVIRHFNNYEGIAIYQPGEGAPQVELLRMRDITCRQWPNDIPRDSVLTELQTSQATLLGPRDITFDQVGVFQTPKKEFFINLVPGAADQVLLIDTRKALFQTVERAAGFIQKTPPKNKITMRVGFMPPGTPGIITGTIEEELKARLPATLPFLAATISTTAIQRPRPAA